MDYFIEGNLGIIPLKTRFVSCETEKERGE